MNNSSFIAPAAASHKPQRRRGDHTIRKHACPVCPESGKIRYRDHKQAGDALRSAKWRRRIDDLVGVDSRRNEARAYKCADCKGWHTTSLAVWVEQADLLALAAA